MDVLRPRPSPHPGNASYFSFFSDLRPSGRAATTLETLALAAVFLVSVAANVAAMLLVSRERRPLANKAVLTLNLFVADLLFVCMTPLIAAVRWTVSWRLGAGACRVVLYVVSVSGCVTISTLASISVERLQAILSLQAAPAPLNPRMVGAAVGCVWAFSALTSMPLSLFFTVLEVDSSDARNVHICTLKWPDVVGEIIWNVVFISLCFFLPGLVIVLSYSKILQISKSYRRRARPRGSPSVSRQDIKLFRTLLVLMLSFLVMWSPIFIVTFLILVRNFGGHLPVSSTTFFWVTAFTLTNSALNPILYSVCQSRRGAWRRACGCGAVIAPLKRPPDSGGGEGQQRGAPPPQACATTDVACCGVTGKMSS